MWAQGLNAKAHLQTASMAGKVLNTIGKLGIGLAITGGIVSNALYNGRFKDFVIII